MIEKILKCDPWIISDTHFGHKKIAEYAKRPEDWEERIIVNWNAKIKDEDLVLHLGDFGLAPREMLEFYYNNLNGIIWLQVGNHERNRLKLYERLGMVVLEKESYSYNEYIFSHRPLLNINGFHYNIHGHRHQIKPIDSRYINMSVELWDYKPVKFSTLEKLIKENPGKIITGELL